MRCKGKRFGVLRQAMGYHPDVDAAMEQSIAALKAAGAVVVDVEDADLRQVGRCRSSRSCSTSSRTASNAYLKSAGAPHGSLKALIDWNTAHAPTVMPFFGQEIFEKAETKGPLTDAAYVKARDTARRLAGKDGLLAALEKDKLDALIAPSTSPAWLTDHVLGDHFAGAGYGVAAVAGTPEPDGADGRDATACRSASRSWAAPTPKGSHLVRLRLRTGHEGAEGAAVQGYGANRVIARMLHA